MSGEEPEPNTESRSDRLRRRRAQRDRTGERSETAEPSDSSKPSETNETDKPSVKEEQVGTYMYLPESQKKEVERLYNVLKAEYEYEYDEAFEKNRHFYPILIRHGLEGLEELDASEIRQYVDSIS